MTTLSFESKNGGDSGNGQLLRDIEEISKALYLPKISHRPLISYFNAGSDSAAKPPLLTYTKPQLHPDFFDDDEEKINRGKKSSAWGWKPLKALSHIRQRKFSCCFFCHVHHIENLPSSFDGLDVTVHWKRKDELVSTLASRVCNGLVEFEDTLMSRCSVYGARSGQGNFVKYEPKHFLLYASVVGLKGIDLGKHWIDLTRFLPLVFEELEEDKCSGKWTTSFKLGEKAQGAILHVSFGFLVMNNSFLESDDSMRLPLVFNFNQTGVGIVDRAADCGPGSASGMLRRAASVPCSLDNASSSSSQSSDVKVLYQGWPNPMLQFSGSVDILYRKLDEDIMDASRKFDSIFEGSESFRMLSNPCCDTENEASADECGNDDYDAEFTVTERGIEMEWSTDNQLELEESAAEKLDISSVEMIDVAEIFKDEPSDENVKSAKSFKGSGGSLATTLLHDNSCSREMEGNSNIEDLDCDIWNVFISESVESEPLRVGSESLWEEIFEDVSSNPGPSKMAKSLSLDSIMKAVADDFCRLVGENDGSYNSSRSSEHGSPRERLLREFEKDTMVSGSFLYDSDTQREDAEFSYYSGLAISSLDSAKEDTVKLPTIHSAMADLIETQSTTNKTKPKMLEHLETQSLMQRCGFDEEAFQSSSDSSIGGFGSPIYLSPDEPTKLPSLGEGLGPVLQLNDGGFLRSMSPSLFMGSKSGGTLIIQVSQPAVLPAAMGSELLEVLQCMASGGLELLTKQAHELMPLDDLSGKILQNLACSEEMCGRNELHVKFESRGSFCTFSGNGLNFTSVGDGSGFQDFSIKELVLLVMDSIESLSIEGLRIQSGMSELVAPSSIMVKADNDLSAFIKKDDSIKSSEEEGVAGLQISTVNRAIENTDSLMILSLPLDEWLRLDSGHFTDRDQKSETTLRIMAAHHAKSRYFSTEKSIKDNSRENASLKCGLLEDDLIIALRVQLRDPLRDFEPVGSPMLALIQVRREFDNSDSDEQSEERTNLEEDTSECFIGKSFGGECIARFVLEEVHLAGLMAESGKEEIWGSKRQQQLGSRWLLANNMSNKHRNSKTQSSKSNAIISRVFKKRQTGNILWSISRESQRLGEHFNTQDSYLRNPDVVFS